MTTPVEVVRRIADAARDALTGEPARAIGYGGAAIVYIVAAASGAIPDVSPEQALVQATAALAVVAAVVESIRHVVYSPNTVAFIVAEADDSLYAEGDTT